MPPHAAIIIGASSGIGAAICRELVAQQVAGRIGIAARRKDKLDALAGELPGIEVVREMDLRDIDQSRQTFLAMLEALTPVDYVFLSSGTGHINEPLEWPPEEETIAVNAMGFAALASLTMAFFEKQGHGHLIGISSVAAVRGAGAAPAYGASKAFASSYLEALRFRAIKSGLPIYVTDIRPGFVDTAMMKTDKPFWVATPAVAARQILDAVEKRKHVAYVTRRWRLIAWVLRLMPARIYGKLG